MYAAKSEAESVLKITTALVKLFAALRLVLVRLIKEPATPA